MNFDDGNQNNNDKNNELRVRPVRRFDCCTLPVPRPGAGLLRLPALQAQQRQRPGFRSRPRAEPVTATQRPDRLALELAAQLLAQFRTDPVEFPAAKLVRLEALLGKFGMTPADRAKVGGKKEAPKGNPFADL